MTSSLQLLLCVLLGTVQSVSGGSHTGKDIVATAIASGKHSILAAALTKAGLVETLQGAGPFTVFAPTDDAFKAALAALGATAEELLARSDLAAILTYHVASGAKVMSTAITNGQMVTTVMGATIKMTVGANGVKANDAKVIGADISCSNGVIHQIDKVLLPPDIVQIAMAAGPHTILVAALTKAGLVATLQGAGPFTVFAPTDDAFKAALAALKVTAEELLARSDLADILKYHVHSGASVKSTALKDGQKIKTVQGASLTVAITGGSVSISGAKVVGADIVASNGLIHQIDKVLLPPAPSPSPSTASNMTAASNTPARGVGAVSGLVVSLLAVLQMA